MFAGPTRTDIIVPCDATPFDIDLPKVAPLCLAFARSSQGAKLPEVDALAEIAGTIAHELGQPLSAIAAHGSAALRWLEVDPPDLDEARICLREIVSTTLRAAAIVSSTRKLAASRPVSRKPVHLANVMERVADLLRDDLERQGIDVAIIDETNAAAILAEQTLVEQLAINLVSNAAQAMRGRCHESKITMRTSFVGRSMIHCSIEDGGPGIPPAIHSRIFEKHFTTKVNGAGIGLYLSRHIVEAHGGAIAADNQSIHGGARLSFVLPLEAPIPPDLPGAS